MEEDKEVTIDYGFCELVDHVLDELGEVSYYLGTITRHVQKEWGNRGMSYAAQKAISLIFNVKYELCTSVLFKDRVREVMRFWDEEDENAFSNKKKEWWDKLTEAADSIDKAVYEYVDGTREKVWELLGLANKRVNEVQKDVNQLVFDLAKVVFMNITVGPAASG